MKYLAVQGVAEMVASLGFEPRQTDPESVVLPLHHEADRALLKKRRLMYRMCAAMTIGKCRLILVDCLLRAA